MRKGNKDKTPAKGVGVSAGNLNKRNKGMTPEQQCKYHEKFMENIKSAVLNDRSILEDNADRRQLDTLLKAQECLTFWFQIYREGKASNQDELWDSVVIDHEFFDDINGRLDVMIMHGVYPMMPGAPFDSLDSALNGGLEATDAPSLYLKAKALKTWYYAGLNQFDGRLDGYTIEEHMYSFNLLYQFLMWRYYVALASITTCEVKAIS